MNCSKHAALVVSAALFSACADVATTPRTMSHNGATAAIVNGTPTGGDYASVGALLFDFFGDGIAGDDEWCTGSLIAPDVFLTAAHCIVTPFTPPGTTFYVSFAPDLLAQNITIIQADSSVFDPDYGRSKANLHDLALVFLPQGSTAGMTPLSLPPAGALDAMSAKGALSKELFVNVGYGTSATKTGKPDFPWDGKRNTSRSEFRSLTQTWLGLLMNSSATGEGGDCYGDSGGPKFRDGDNTTIYATVTTGDVPCRATSWDWRLDTPDARGFLGKYVQLP